MRRLILASLLLPPLIADAAVSFEVRSEPLGVIGEQITSHESGSRASTPMFDPERTGFGLRFTHWSLSPADQHAGCNASRCVDPTGQSLLSLEFEINADTVAVAHFTQIEQDTDGDELPDSLELRYFGNLDPLPQDDNDGDGIPLGDELRMGLNPRLLNIDLAGGSSAGQAPLTSLILDEGQVFFFERSSPRGLLSRKRVVPLNTTVTTLDAEALHGQFYFAYWDIDGVIQRDATGGALFRANRLVESEHVSTANYVIADTDTDLDGVPDWFELRWFQDLGTPFQNTADGDTLTLFDELMRNTSPTLADELRPGGTSRSPELSLRLSLTPMLHYLITSQPAGLFPTLEDQVPPETLIWTPGPPRLSSGQRFSFWAIDGERQFDPAGAALQGSISLVPVDPMTEVVGTYFPEGQDTDADGLPDWFENSIVNGDQLSPQSDPDGDGITLENELTRGLSPLLAETESHGGITVSQPGPAIKLLVFKDDFEAP